ncbi:MAG TPA: hypothetical protein VFL80_06800 [Thermoanaerobaculia bacterium]|nr:hypothetical protein [Thermoanaerobaculia bacterium]
MNSEITHLRLPGSRERTVVGMGSVTSVLGAGRGITRDSLQWGDRITIVTQNSIYVLTAGEDDKFVVSGGWFDRKELSPADVGVAGCTWGGSSINRNVIAAPGLCLEFGNGVVTTEIQRVTLTRYQSDRSVN